MKKFKSFQLFLLLCIDINCSSDGFGLKNIVKQKKNEKWKSWKSNKINWQREKYSLLYLVNVIYLIFMMVPFVMSFDSKTAENSRKCVHYNKERLSKGGHMLDPLRDMQ